MGTVPVEGASGALGASGAAGDSGALGASGADCSNCGAEASLTGAHWPDGTDGASYGDTGWSSRTIAASKDGMLGCGSGADAGAGAEMGAGLNAAGGW